MDEPREEEALAPGAALTEEEQPRDLLGLLRKQREELANQQYTFAKIPGYDDPALYGRYQLLDGADLNKITSRVRNVKDRWTRNLLAATDALVHSCTGLFVDLEGEGDESTYTQITVNGEPVGGFEPLVASQMGFEAVNGRQVVFGLFGGNELAVVQHSMRIQRWMGNTNIDVDQEFLMGEI